MKRTKWVLLLALLGVLLIIVTKYAHAATHAHAAHVKHSLKHAARVTRAKHAKSPPVVIVSKEPTDAPDRDWRPDITEAQGLLAALPSDKDTPQQFNWHLAIKCGTTPTKVVTMTPNASRNATADGYTISWALENGINTHFAVKEPAGCRVLAQKRVVNTPTGFTEAVYTAYAPELDTKTMRDAGMDYLRHLQHLAYNRIQDHDVRSRVAPNRTVAEEIPASMVLRLMITEHVDPLHMKYVGIEQCIHEVLFTLAANGEHAYAYAKSSVGARGLPQFMEDSYDRVRVNYPQALLEPNFERGMANLPNAVLASVLLLDLELTHLPKDYLARFTASSSQLAAFLAAGYNRNPVHVVQTYRKTHALTGGNAPFENKMYVKIQSWIGSWLEKHGST